MFQESFSKDKRNLRSILLSADFVVVGGGISGICAAVSAARAGVKTILVQDRPVPVSYTHLRAPRLGMISYAVFCLKKKKTK